MLHRCSISYVQETAYFLLCVLLYNVTIWLASVERLACISGGLLSSLLWVSVPLKLDVGHWTACHYTATTQTWWTCLRQGPEREFNVRRQWEEEPVHSHSGDTDLNRYMTSRSTAIICGCLLRDTPFFSLLPN